MDSEKEDNMSADENDPQAEPSQDEDHEDKEVASPAHSNSPHSPASNRSRSGSPVSHHSASPVSHHSASPVSHHSASPVSHHSASPVSHHSASPRSGNGSDKGSPPGSPADVPQSPASQTQSREASPVGSNAGRSRSQSPNHSAPASPAGSHKSGSHKSGSRSRSRSKSGSRSRSGSGSPRRSRSGSPQSNRSGSRSRSRSRSRSGSPHSPPISPVGSGGRQSRSRSRSKSGSRSRSRSKSGSRSRSRSGSPNRARSKSKSRSRSRSGSGSPQHRRSRSRSGSRASSVGSGGHASGSESKPKKKKRVLDDSEDEAGGAAGSGDEEKENELLADIFGSSDEDEEFKGFDASEIPKKEKKKKTAVKSDDEGDADVGATGQLDNDAAPPQDGSDDENLDEVRKDGESGGFVSDFDLMMARKKEEQQKQRRKRKDVDLINDNDDLIAELIVKMKEAANLDREHNQKKEVAIKKVKMLPYVMDQLKKTDLHGIFLESGILSALTEWLAPLPDKSLPQLNIRESFLRILGQFPSIHSDMIKSSGIGKAIMYLYKHPKELKENRKMAGRLINEWSRPIFNLTSNYKLLSKEEREERDYEQIPKKRRTSMEGAQTPRRDIDKALAGEKKALRPGDPGWIYRARVPMPSHKDYVVRPKTGSDYQPPTTTKGAKKPIDRYEKHKRSFMEKKKLLKTQKAVTISIEGRNMSL